MDALTFLLIIIFLGGCLAIYEKRKWKKIIKNYIISPPSDELLELMENISIESPKLLGIQERLAISYIYIISGLIASSPGGLPTSGDTCKVLTIMRQKSAVLILCHKQYEQAIYILNIRGISGIPLNFGEFSRLFHPVLAISEENKEEEAVSLSKIKIGDADMLPSPELLMVVNAFLDNHYTFRCEKQYKGFFGRIRAFFDREDAEKQEYQKIAEHETRDRLTYESEDVTFYSHPPSEEDLKQEALSREARKQKILNTTLEETFSATLMELIGAKGKDNVEIYKRAHINRKLFSKIRNQYHYIPSKRTVIAFAVALELSLDETNSLLKRAGFALSRSIMFDVIIEYFILQGKYDIFEINEVLAAYGQSTLT